MTPSAAISPIVRTMVVGLACAATLLAAQPARADQEDVQRYLIAARRLFQNADNERALEQVQRAKKLSRGLEDDVIVALYEGLILADLGRIDDSRAAFRTALLLKPDAVLPVKVSPKVSAPFEELRRKVQQELARVQAQQDAETARLAQQAPPPAAQPERAVTRPDPAPVAPVEPVRLDGAPRAAAGKPRSAEVAIPVAPAPEPAKARVIPWTPIAVAGAAVLVAGAGAVFGQMSRDSYRTAQSSAFQDERVKAMDATERNATVANVLFAAAGAIGVGAAVTFVW